MNIPEGIGRQALNAAIGEWIIGRNGERDRIILRMHLFDGPTLETLQRRMDDMGYPLSVDRLKQIIITREQQLAKHI